MKSLKMVVALLVAIGFVFAIAAYAQEAKVEKAAEKTEKADKAATAKEEKAVAAKEEAAKPAEAAKPTAKEEKAAAAGKAEEKTEKAAVKTEKAEEKAAKREEAKEAATPAEAAKPTAKEEKAAAAGKAEEKAGKAAEKLDKMENKEATGEMKKKDILGAAAYVKDFGTFLELVKIAGLEETLKGKGPLTVLAPVDAAFAKMPAGELDALKKDKEKLAGVLKLHIVDGKVTIAELKKMKAIKTLAGDVAVSVEKVGETEVLSVGGAKVSAINDIDATNGVIHGLGGIATAKK